MILSLLLHKKKFIFLVYLSRNCTSVEKVPMTQTSRKPIDRDTSELNSLYKKKFHYPFSSICLIY